MCYFIFESTTKMKSNITLTAQNFGDALVRAIALHHGILFTPFQITHSSFIPPEQINVGISDAPLSPPIVRPETRTENNFNREFTLTSEDVLQGLSAEISLDHLATAYVGNRVETLSFELPSEIRINLIMTAQGSLKDQTEHIFKPFD